MDYTILVIIIIVVSVFVILDKSLNLNAFEFFTNSDNNGLYKVARPFVNVYDDQGNQLNVTLLSRPFFMQSHWDEYDKIKEKFLILGISSYQEFPNQPRNPKDNYNQSNIYDSVTWTNMCEGWLHCFRDQSKYIPKTMKSLLLSESDFADCNLNKPDPTVEKKYDFIYICHRDNSSDCSANEWVAYNKNLDLANECFKIMCEKYNYKGLLVGRAGCSLPKGCNGKLEATEKLDYNVMMKKYDEAKFIFLPNIHDASPRVLTEALCHNIPCLVNENIVGGWKYVTEETGTFFSGTKDFEEKLQYMMNNLNKFTPRKHFLENYGIIKSGEKFRDFVYDIFGDRVNIPRENVKYLTMEFEKKDYKECEL
jgi:glycosyltransferase involved in cell wall biosynthesis